MAGGDPRKAVSFLTATEGSGGHGGGDLHCLRVRTVLEKPDGVRLRMPGAEEVGDRRRWPATVEGADRHGGAGCPQQGWRPEAGKYSCDV